MRWRRSVAVVVVGLAVSAACSDRMSAPRRMAVEVIPDRVTVNTGATFGFGVQVSNQGSASSAIVWSVREATGGSVNTTGLYTAPASPGTFHVVATSVADPAVSGVAQVTVSEPDNEIISRDRRTTWRPGIPGGVPADADATRPATVWLPAGDPYGGYSVDPALGNDSADATAAIATAIQSAGDAASEASRRIVRLAAGTYRASQVELDRSWVTLRGSGRTQTTIRITGGGRGIIVGTPYPTWSSVVDVVGSVAKGATEIEVANASDVQPGDVIQIDQLEDGDEMGTTGFVWRYDIFWSMRGPRPADVNGPGSPGGYRPIGQQVEVASKSGNVLTLANRIHIAYPASQSPQVFHTATVRPGKYGIRWAGVEDLKVLGASEAQTWLANAAYSWVKGIDSDGRFGGSLAHLVASHAYRCEVRDSYFHHATNYDQGGNAYGVMIGMQSTDNLVENDVVVYLNKPTVCEAGGGGNVYGYNYVDEAVNGSLTGTWQESALDGSHGSFCHYDLYEGNLTPNVGTDATHGNNGWITFFRNRATGRNTSAHTTGNVRAVGVDGWNREHTSVGNVLLQPGLVVNGTASVLWSTPAMPELEGAAVYRIGANAWNKTTGDMAYDVWDNGLALSLFYRHMDFDYVTNSIHYDPANAITALPDSLYLTAKPAFFGALVWPWVNPTGATDGERVLVLPAKQRYDAGNP